MSSSDDFFKQILRNKEIRDWAFNQHRYQEKQRDIEQSNKLKEQMPQNINKNQEQQENLRDKQFVQSKIENKQLKFWKFLNKCNQINNMSGPKEEEQSQIKPQQQQSQSQPQRTNQKVLIFEDDDHCYEEKKIVKPCKPKLLSYADLKQGMLENIKNLERILAVNHSIISNLQRKQIK